MGTLKEKKESEERKTAPERPQDDRPATMSRNAVPIRRPAQRLYSLQDAAVYLGRTVWGVRELIWAGELPIVKSPGGKKFYIDVNDLDAYIDKNKGKFNG